MVIDTGAGDSGKRAGNGRVWYEILTSGWPFGAFLCKSTPYLQGVSVCASVYTLAAIALDRYLAICHTPKWRMTSCACRALIAFIWTLGAGLLVPWALYYEQFKAEEDGGKAGQGALNLCHELWPDFSSQRAYFVGAIFVGTYLFPLLIVLACYVCIGVRVWNRQAPGVAKDHCVIRRCRLKVVKMLAVMVALFALSWLPLHVIYLHLYFPLPSLRGHNVDNDDDSHVQVVYSVAVPIAQWLELSNSGINPLVYCFFSNNFRREFRALCWGWTGGRKGGSGAGGNRSDQWQRGGRRGRRRGGEGRLHASGSGLFSNNSSSRFMTMDYVNGHVTVSFRREAGQHDLRSTL
ncbi:neuropeptide SIFamide receptor-like [Babylonia areolata]|uniref:neuropeptide SIFamide receptor-like n=1 Tax=Babylonia areolata TaxID=304850 RepID=UPI003FD39FD9